MDSVELHKSDSLNGAHQWRWFVTPTDNHMPVFSPPQAGDAGLKACMTWLEREGYKPSADSYPNSEVYVR